MLKNPDKEVGFRMAKWVIMNLESEQLLKPEEIERIWRELLSYYAPPMSSVEVPCGSMLCRIQGVMNNAEGS